MTNRRHIGRVICAIGLVLVLILGTVGNSARAQRPRASVTINMVMDWPYAWMGWAPWIVADALGYYKQAGITLKIVIPATVADPAKVLGTGHADLAFTTILDVIEARAAGAPVTGIGAYSQFNNWGLISWKSQNIRPNQLKGKTIGVYPDAWTKTQLTVMLQHVGLKISDVKLVYTPNDTVPLLLTHKVDVITGITNAEQTEAEINGKRPTVMYLASKYGVPDSYVQVLAGNDSFLKAHGDVVKAWMSATERGVAYAIAHPAQTVQMFLKRYPSALAPDYALASWQKTIPLFSSSQTKVHGYFWQLPQIWQATQQILLSNKIIDQSVPVNQLYSNAYLP